MKRILKFKNLSWLISITFFIILILTLNFIVKPKAFNSFSQINFSNNENNCFLTINVEEKEKQLINNQIIIIYFLKNKEYQKILANNWINGNQLLVLENVCPEDYINQSVIITFGYESLLVFILNNIT